MPETIICPDGARITCAIYEIADIMRVPSDFLWLSSVWIPAISALISLGVLLFSVTTSRSAKRQAARSEAARIESEWKRSEDAHADRIRAAFAAIFTSVGELGEQLLHWRPGTRHPTDFRVLGDIAAARLESKTIAEKRLTERLSDFVVNSRMSNDQDARGAMLLEMWGLVILWFDTEEADRESTVLPLFDDLDGATRGVG